MDDRSRDGEPTDDGRARGNGHHELSAISPFDVLAAASAKHEKAEIAADLAYVLAFGRRRRKRAERFIEIWKLMSSAIPMAFLAAVLALLATWLSHIWPFTGSGHP